MLGVVGSAAAATCFLPAVLIKGVLEEQEEGLPEQGRAGQDGPFVPTSIGSAYVVLH